MGNILKQQGAGSHNHPMLSSCEKENEMLTLSLECTPEIDDWILKLKQFKSTNPPSTLLLPKVQGAVAGKFCGTEKSYKLIYPNFPTNLKKEIQDRRKFNEKYSQTELWYLLYELLSCSYVFEKKKMKSGDIRPVNILLSSDGYTSLVNFYSFPGELTNYHKSFTTQQVTYLAPEELGELEQKIKYPKSDPSTAQSFSIGLTIIDAALLCDSEKLYDMKKLQFLNSQFKENIVKFKTDSYSPFFVKTVLNLLEGKSIERVTPGEALAIIRPYQNSIVNLQDFEADRDKSKQSLLVYQSLK